ncbi:HlyD family type I secretion periplasmic adaptor subunit [Rickettsiales bacterium LUAb2]
MNQTRFNYKMVAFPIFLMIVIFLLWASLMHVNEYVQGTGKIIPSGDIQKVQHLEGGIISEILVKEGQKVHKDQVLYRIRNENAISDLNSLQVQLYAKSAEEARLRAELAGADNIQFPADVMQKVPNIIDNQKRLFFQRRNKFRDSIDVLTQQAEQKRYALIENQNSAKNLAVQYQYAQQQQQILERLVKEGAGSQKDLIGAKLYTQQLLTQYDQAQNQIPTNQKALDEAIARIAQAKTEYIVDVQTQLSQVLVDIEKLKEQISVGIDKVLRTDIVSPVDGLVKQLNFHTVGGIVAPGQVVAEIIPTDDKLIVDGRISPQDRGRVWVGEKANIRITAYDSTIHGQIEGVITEVSADTFTETNGVTYYSIKLQATKPDFGINKPLYPGMVANINIATGSRTIIVYFFKPILKVIDSALIEP